MNSAKHLVLGVMLTTLWYCTPPSPTLKVELEESTLSDLNIEEKVGQMFMVRYTGDFYRNDAGRFQKVKRLITERHLGGVITFVGSVHGTVANLNEFQSFPKIPLLVAADFERGVGQKIDGATLFPSNMAMAATGDPELSYEQGKITALEARAIGVHVTFSPVVRCEQ